MADILGIVLKAGNPKDLPFPQIFSDLPDTYCHSIQMEKHTACLFGSGYDRGSLTRQPSHLILHTGQDNTTDQHPWQVQAVQNVSRDLVVIKRDRFSIRPLYYTENSNFFAYSTHYTMLLSLLEKPSYDSLAVLSLLALGRVIGLNTLTREIKRFPEGTHFQYSNNALRVQSNSKNEAYPGKVDVSDVASMFIETLQKKPGYDSSVYVPLTGGVDSRTIISSCPIESDLTTYTRGSLDCWEVQTARMVATIMQKPHVCYPFPHKYIQSHAARIVSITGGLVPLTDGHAIHPLNQLYEEGCKTVVPGIGGEIGRGFWRLPAIMKGEAYYPTSLATQLFNRENLFTDSKLRSVLPANMVSLLPQLQKEYEAIYRSCCDDAMIDHPVAWHDEFYFKERIRNFTAFGPVIWNQFFHVTLPFLKYPYLDGMRYLSHTHRKRPLVHSEIIRRNEPELLNLRLIPSGGKMNSLHIHRHLLRTKWSLQKRFHRSRRLSPQNYARWFREEMPFVSDQLTMCKSGAGEFFEFPALETVISRHMSGDDHHKLLGRFLTLSLHHNLFISA
jgi:hypothetical protein